MCIRSKTFSFRCLWFSFFMLTCVSKAFLWKLFCILRWICHILFRHISRTVWRICQCLASLMINIYVYIRINIFVYFGKKHLDISLLELKEERLICHQLHTLRNYFKYLHWLRLHSYLKKLFWSYLCMSANLD